MWTAGHETMAPSGPIPALVARTGLENATLTFWGGSFLAGKMAWALSGYLPTENADYCMLANEWGRLRSRVCLLRLRVCLGSVLESELRQK